MTFRKLSPGMHRRVCRTITALTFTSHCCFCWSEYLIVTGSRDRTIKFWQPDGRQVLTIAPADNFYTLGGNGSLEFYSRLAFHRSSLFGCLLDGIYSLAALSG